jgi:hypothetical protein
VGQKYFVAEKSVSPPYPTFQTPSTTSGKLVAITAEQPKQTTRPDWENLDLLTKYH